MSCTRTPPSEPTSETSNYEDSAYSSISFGSLPVVHTDNDFLALDLTNPNVNRAGSMIFFWGGGGHLKIGKNLEKKTRENLENF